MTLWNTTSHVLRTLPASGDLNYPVVLAGPSTIVMLYINSTIQIFWNLKLGSNDVLDGVSSFVEAQ